MNKVIEIKNSQKENRNKVVKITPAGCFRNNLPNQKKHYVALFVVGKSEPYAFRKKFKTVNKALLYGRNAAEKFNSWKLKEMLNNMEQKGAL